MSFFNSNHNHRNNNNNMENFSAFNQNERFPNIPFSMKSPQHQNELSNKPPGIPLNYDQQNFNLNNNSTFLINNMTPADQDLHNLLSKNEEISYLEKQNEDLRNEILSLEAQLQNANMLDSQTEGSQEKLEMQNLNSKEIQTDLMIEEGQTSYFLESLYKQKKISMFLPTDIIAHCLHKEIVQFESFVTDIQKEFKQKFNNFLPIFKSVITEITRMEPEVYIFL